MAHRKLLILHISLLFIFLVGSACGEKTRKKDSASCTFSQTNDDQVFKYCAEYSGLKSDQIDKVREICTKDTSGTWALGASCGSLELIGRCSFRSENINFTYFYYPAFDKENAEANCNAALGEWQPL